MDATTESFEREVLDRSRDLRTLPLLRQWPGR